VLPWVPPPPHFGIIQDHILPENSDRRHWCEIEDGETPGNCRVWFYDICQQFQVARKRKTSLPPNPTPNFYPPSLDPPAPPSISKAGHPFKGRDTPLHPLPKRLSFVGQTVREGWEYIHQPAPSLRCTFNGSRNVPHPTNHFNVNTNHITFVTAPETTRDTGPWRVWDHHTMTPIA